MRDSHDIDVLEFRAGFAPVTMSQNVVPADFAAGFHLAALRHGPVEKRIETSNADAGFRRLNVFKKSGKSANDFPAVERFGDLAKFIERQTGFGRASAPGRKSDLFRSKFTFQRQENFPFLIVKRDHVDRHHLRSLFRSTPGFDRPPSDMPDTQSENSLCRHEPEMIRADCFRKQFAMPLQRESVRHFDRRPKFVFGTGSHRIGGAQNDMAGKRIALKHPIESRIDFLRRNFPGDERAVREIGCEQCLSHATNGSRRATSP